MAHRIIFSGDTEKCKALIGNARRVMWLLRNMMKLRGLQQLSIRMTPYPGAVIICSKVFGLRTTEIIVSRVGPPEEPPEWRCLCNCNFAFGIILEEQDTLLDDKYPLYTVLVCRKKTLYSIERDILPSDWSKYIPGQKVILIPYNEMLYTCCSGEIAATGCSPIKTEEQMDSEDWRTKMRIIPWRGFRLKKWIAING